jgi:hypothetical protein
MSYNADLLNAYRAQLAKIRAAFAALEFEECYAVHGYAELDNAISSTETDDLENMYVSKEAPIILPDDLSDHHLPDVINRDKVSAE